MKKLVLLLSVAFLVGCSCLGQIPPVKYVEMDTTTCIAVIPDFIQWVTAETACGNSAIVTQSPTAGTTIVGETLLTIFALTESGQESEKNVRIIPIDPGKAIITIDAEFFAYGDEEVFDMIRVFNAWVYNYPARFNSAKDTGGALSWMEWKTVVNLPMYEDSVLWYAEMPVNDYYEYIRLTYLTE